MQLHLSNTPSFVVLFLILLLLTCLWLGIRVSHRNRQGRLGRLVYVPFHRDGERTALALGRIFSVRRDTNPGTFVVDVEVLLPPIGPPTARTFRQEDLVPLRPSTSWRSVWLLHYWVLRRRSGLRFLPPTIYDRLYPASARPGESA